MNKLVIVETTALPVNAMRIAGEVLGRTPGASQAGRYGTEIALNDREQALAVARELRAYGYRACVA